MCSQRAAGRFRAGNQAAAARCSARLPAPHTAPLLVARNELCCHIRGNVRGQRPVHRRGGLSRAMSFCRLLHRSLPKQRRRRQDRPGPGREGSGTTGLKTRNGLAARNPLLVGTSPGDMANAAGRQWAEASGRDTALRTLLNICRLHRLSGGADSWRPVCLKEPPICLHSWPKRPIGSWPHQAPRPSGTRMVPRPRFIVPWPAPGVPAKTHPVPKEWPVPSPWNDGTRYVDCRFQIPPLNTRRLTRAGD